jgi:hypothetical protein
MGPAHIDSQPTRLYLGKDNQLSTSPPVGFSKIYHIEKSIEYKTVLACDMVGNQCTFGIVFAARPEANVKAKVEIITCRDGIETVISSSVFSVKSRSYTRYLESLDIEDPACCSDDVLILRITNISRETARLSLMVGSDEPFDSYVEVPRVKINQDL